MQLQKLEVEDHGSTSIKALFGDPRVMLQLYAEVCASGGEASTSLESRWDEMQNEISIRFNKPGERLAEHEVMIDRRASVRELKRLIGEKLGLNVMAFRLCSSSLSKAEFKFPDKALAETQPALFDGAAVFTELGQPMAEGHVKLEVHLYETHSRPTTQSPRECDGLKTENHSFYYHDKKN